MKRIAWIALCGGFLFASAARAQADDRGSFLALQHFDRLSSYRMTVVTRRGNRTVIQNITVAARNREADYLPQMHQTDVMVGKRLWIRRADGTWIESPQPAPESSAADATRTILKVIDHASVTSLAAGVLGGVPVRHYRIVQTRPGRAPVTSDVWIGARDGLPRRLEVSQDGTTISGVFSAFGETLAIPSPPAFRR